MIVLDTHVWIWWVDDHHRLKPSIRDRIDTEGDVRICAISLLKISMAVSLGCLRLRPSVRSWLEVAQSAEQIRVEPLTDALCLESTALPGEFHCDPADRLIVALARLLDVPLITADQKTLDYPSVAAIAAGQ